MHFDFNTVLALCIFIFTYFFIATEKIHRTIVVLVGGSLLILFNVISQEEAFAAIDFNTVFLLIGMMIVVSIMKRSGLFQYLAVISAKLAKGNPIWILVFMSTITAVVSALLDNVTTVLLVAPVSLAITDSLGLHPVPFLISEAFASNVGGAATLIGDPPNIMIGSAGKIGFNSFLYNLSPIVIIIHILFLLAIILIFRKELIILPELRESILEFDETKAITDKKLARKSLFVIGLAVLAFALHEVLHYEAATVALAAAALLLLISNQNPEKILAEIEWPTIFFFIGLFIIVAGVVKVGIMDSLSTVILSHTKGNIVLTTIVLVWISAFAAAFTNNIAFVAAMIPLVKNLGTEMPIMPLWWALSLGACLGGNGTLTGASANMLVAGFSKREGAPISYKKFLLFGMPMMIGSVILSSIYIYFRYLR